VKDASREVSSLLPLPRDPRTDAIHFPAAALARLASGEVGSRHAIDCGRNRLGNRRDIVTKRQGVRGRFLANRQTNRTGELGRGLESRRNDGPAEGFGHPARLAV